jgi:SAM-dependent methyltransferase
MDEEAMGSAQRLRYGRRVSEYDASRAAYAATRRADKRIAAAIERALGDARSVVNVGAGAGSYEPRDREVVAVEPSATMRAQRPPELAEAIAARAEELPLADDSVDAALAVLAVHHWHDPARGLAEMRRVARRTAVVLTYDVEQADALWLVRDYLPEIAAMDRARFPSMEAIAEALGDPHARVERVPIPHDCRDGFLGAYWRRPERYLDPAVRPGISPFGDLDPEVLGRALARLRNDIDSGAWRRRYGGLLSMTEYDLGYRLVVADTRSG